MRLWLLVLAVGCTSLERTPVQVAPDDDDARVPWADAVEGPEPAQCRVDLGDGLTDTDNTSCGVLAGPALAPGALPEGLWVAPNVEVRRLRGGLPSGTSVAVGDGLVVVEEGALVAVDGQGRSTVLVDGAVRSVARLSDGGLGVVADQRAWALYLRPADPYRR